MLVGRKSSGFRSMAIPSGPKYLLNRPNNYMYSAVRNRACTSANILKTIGGFIGVIKRSVRRGVIVSSADRNVAILIRL